MTALTYIINVILGISLDVLTEMERCQSKTAKMSSLLLKNVIAKFLNTTVVFFILYRMNPVDPLTSDGLSSKIMGLLTFSAQLKIFNDLLQPVRFFKKWLSIAKLRRQKNINMFQVHLNTYIQNDEFNLPSQYSYYIFMIYLISFYGLLVPFSAPVLVLLFGIHYWVDKYVLFAKMSNPVDYGYGLTQFILKSLECSVLIMAVGNWYWSGVLHHLETRYSSYLSTGSILLVLVYLMISLFCPSYIKERFLSSLMSTKINHHSYSFYLKANRFNKLYWK